MRFDYKANPDIGECIGLIAQDVRPYLPETITETEGEIDGKTVNDLLQFDASPIIFALINAVKTLAARLTAIEEYGVT